MLHGHWWEQAKCLGKSSRDNDPWDPPGTAYIVPPDARTICDQCRVQVECLADALRHNDEGVRGNTTMRQRKALLRPRLRQSCPVCRTQLSDPTTMNDKLIQFCPGCGLSWRTKRPTSRKPGVNQINEPVDSDEEMRRDAHRDAAVPQPSHVAR